MPAVSLVNDVVGPVMRGPSSSHCAAALRIGRLARDLMGGDLADVLVEFDRAAVEAWAARLEADQVHVHDAPDGLLVQVQAAAFVPDAALAELRPTRVRRLGRVLPVPSRKDVRLPFTGSEELLAFDGDRHTDLWRLAATYEVARSGFGEDEVLARMVDLVRLWRRSIASGIEGTQYEDRVLGHQSGGFRDAMAAGRLLDGGALNRIVLYVTALMEVKSSMGVIVAAPTAGACAALPGAVIAMAESMGLDEEAMARALLAAGLVGMVFTTRWTFAAEVGGCQAEGGAAACMAAAALVTLAGGTRDQPLAAASMALQSMLGLICDPIANRVEAPCLGKNVMVALVERAPGRRSRTASASGAG